MRKIPFAGIELTSQRVRGLRGTSELPGRPASVRVIVILSLLGPHPVLRVLYKAAVTVPRRVAATNYGQAAILMPVQ